jgi:hypothetical protein
MPLAPASVNALDDTLFNAKVSHIAIALASGQQLQSPLIMRGCLINRWFQLPAPGAACDKVAQRLVAIVTKSTKVVRHLGSPMARSLDLQCSTTVVHIIGIPN